MEILQAIILGIIQGLTEFIPVSSSGHLLLAHRLFNISEAGLTFDVALHIGTLLALVVFFWRDIINLAAALVRPSPLSRVARLIAVATVPAVIGGILLEDLAESTFRSPGLVGVMLIIVAILMILAEKYYKKAKAKTKLNDISLSQALSVGLAQTLALIPGVSRSGSTITTGLFAGLDRIAATRFSFLLAIPITFGAILKVLAQDTALEIVKSEQSIFIAGILAAFLSGLAAIAFLLRYLSKHTLEVFAYYRIALALLVIALTLA